MKYFNLKIIGLVLMMAVVSIFIPATSARIVREGFKVVPNFTYPIIKIDRKDIFDEVIKEEIEKQVEEITNYITLEKWTNENVINKIYSSIGNIMGIKTLKTKVNHLIKKEKMATEKVGEKTKKWIWEIVGDLITIEVSQGVIKWVNEAKEYVVEEKIKQDLDNLIKSIKEKFLPIRYRWREKAGVNIYIPQQYIEYIREAIEDHQETDLLRESFNRIFRIEEYDEILSLKIKLFSAEIKPAPQKLTYTFRPAVIKGTTIFSSELMLKLIFPWGDSPQENIQTQEKNIGIISEAGVDEFIAQPGSWKFIKEQSSNKIIALVVLQESLFLKGIDTLEEKRTASDFSLDERIEVETEVVKAVINIWKATIVDGKGLLLSPNSKYVHFWKENGQYRVKLASIDYVFPIKIHDFYKIYFKLKEEGYRPEVIGNNPAEFFQKWGIK
jgi:hypothetical protein